MGKASMKSFDVLLKEWGLEQYIDKMKSEGWDDVRDWSDLTEDDLKNDIGFNKGHLRKWNRNYKEWQAKQKEEEEEEEKEAVAVVQEQIYRNKQPKMQLEKNKQQQQQQQPIGRERFYAMHSFYNGVDQKYLSYETDSGWCRQIYDKASDGKWAFIQSQENGKYLIVNRYPDKRKDHWLSYKEEDKRVGLWTEKSAAAQWKLFPCSVNGMDGFKMKCSFKGVNKGWLSYKNDGKWNHLYEKESDAAVYVMESLSVPQVGKFYAMHSYCDGVDQKYLSYWAEKGWCRQIYDSASDAKW